MPEKDWALDASCQIEAQHNWSINNLRADLRSLLEEMGNTIIPLGDGGDESTSRSLKAAGIAMTSLLNWWTEPRLGGVDGVNHLLIAVFGRH
jgi:hypothetical protein